jgi:hypothetical protein
MSLQRDGYVRRLLALYCGMPHTAARRPSPPDRRLAAQLFGRGIPLELVESAFHLAIARRSHRDPQAPPLPPIRSLAYFLPVLDELLLLPLDPGYLAYLRSRADRTDPTVQISTDLGER